jgi:hypothetical protein
MRRLLHANGVAAMLPSARRLIHNACPICVANESADVHLVRHPQLEAGPAQGRQARAKLSGLLRLVCAIVEEGVERRPRLRRRGQTQALRNFIGRVQATAPSARPQRRWLQALRCQRGTERSRLRTALGRQVALRRAALQHETRRVADAGIGLRMAHQQHRPTRRLRMNRPDGHCQESVAT